jgi:DNA-binding response OmpR family regulator
VEKANILIIEDDEIVARTIERSLRGEEFKISIANSGIDGLKVARSRPPDLVILDVVMPGMDGYKVCREMRNDPLISSVPIMFLTAKIKDDDKIVGFNAGCDDYLTKPFNVDELILRVRAILRRTGSQGTGNNQTEDTDLTPQARSVLRKIKSRTKAAQTNQCIVVDEYVLDTQTYELYTPGRGKVRLTPIQFSLLYHLMTHLGQIFSPERLLDEVWNYPSDAGSPDLVRMHIKNLRNRLEENPSLPMFIKTVPGYGYTINPDTWNNQSEA